MTISISVVIPVYSGEKCLSSIVDEIAPFTDLCFTPNKIQYRINEVILVHDCSDDQSDLIIENLAKKYNFVKPIWLTRNFGQHAATLAGMSAAVGDWVITLDEDGQQNPKYIGEMLDFAIDDNWQVVYANPKNPPPHGYVRNLFSNVAKYIATLSLGTVSKRGVFNSYRLIDGEIARLLAAYCNHGIYLDVGITWIAKRIGHYPVILRKESRKTSYSFPMLLNHFWVMILSSGTRPLRIITIIGIGSLFMSFCFLGYAFYGKYVSETAVAGWTSIVVIISFFSGLMMVSMGIVAEYLALTTSIVMGKPLYVASRKPTRAKK